MSSAPIMETLTATRGLLSIEDFRSELEARIVDGEFQTLTDFKCIVVEKRSSKKYDGIYFRNHFRVNSCIHLLGVGFFGPHNLETAEYEVDLAIESKESGDKLSETFQFVQDARKGEIFRVFFPEPVFLNQDIWYSIRFTLEGPETSVCNVTTIQNTVSVKDSNGSVIEFEFEVGGTDQMPQLYFSPL